MYLWVIIATFIAALAALGTSLRPDIKHLSIEPRAQAVITKIYTQHRGMVKYVYQNRNGGENETPLYEQGEWDPEAHTAYLPHGFNANGGMTRFTSKIYCLDRNSNQLSSVPENCVDNTDPDNPVVNGNCCAASGVITYMVTFGSVPQKWRDIRTGKPNSTLLNSMQDTLGYINGFGYVINSDEYEGADAGAENGYNVLGTSMGVFGQGSRPYTPLPQYVIEDNDFTDVCDPNRNNYCLIYVSSM